MTLLAGAARLVGVFRAGAPHFADAVVVGLPGGTPLGGCGLLWCGAAASKRPPVPRPTPTAPSPASPDACRRGRRGSPRVRLPRRRGPPHGLRKLFARFSSFVRRSARFRASFNAAATAPLVFTLRVLERRPRSCRSGTEPGRPSPSACSNFSWLVARCRSSVMSSDEVGPSRGRRRSPPSTHMREVAGRPTGSRTRRVGSPSSSRSSPAVDRRRKRASAARSSRQRCRLRQ